MQIDLSAVKNIKKAEKDIIVGIDLGTTNSLIAYTENGVPQIIPNEDGSKLVPSVIYIDKNDNVIIGNEAKEHLVTENESTIYSVKRLMGKSYEDLNLDSHKLSYNLSDKYKEGLVRLRLTGKDLSPIELSSYILSSLKKQAEKHLKKGISKCVITVPAYFNDAQRQATKDAGKIAGFNVLRIINEPTAAALAYGLDRNTSGSAEKIIAVYDLGGGTFDISILKLKDGIFEVLATHGDTYLGGDDLDREIMNYFISLIDCHSELTKKELSQLRTESEKCKKYLSDNDKFEKKIILYNSRKEINLSLTRAKFEEMIAPIIQKTETACLKAIKDSEITTDNIDTVVMVGGSTRVPLVYRTVENIFSKKPFNDIDPDEVVALGAAIQADILAGNRTDILLLDVTPLSLGIETIGGVMSVLIPRNTTIPATASEKYTTYMDNQTGVVVNVYQGEREFVKDNRMLSKFTLKNITPQPAGMPKIEVTFLIDTDGILKVKAIDERTGKEQSIEVKPKYGLTDEEVENMIYAGLKNARADIKKRMLAESRTEAESMLHAVEKVLRTNSEIITKEEYERVNIFITDLKETMRSDDSELIREKIKNLDEGSIEIAQKVMDSTVNSALKNKTLNEL
ncbi:molecular chaperone DnaK [soil metagenome]